ncbi:hypothetical protein DGo_PB0224 (plasmid) [Deinococcus gobiensis I-0]|uniref:Uncharacterized protein n=1 Tax=Deinococcus gobiensis (strain DSM 21396 / JCM 16679 / CGMCC 1.7299 / I-0) TaxID=745776 RepID=H8H1U6_DEIGI|nr:hypothetical protein DGo_PB0224 [Deinococcus gobiensis I-0]
MARVLLAALEWNALLLTWVCEGAEGLVKVTRFRRRATLSLPEAVTTPALEHNEATALQARLLELLEKGKHPLTTLPSLKTGLGVSTDAIKAAASVLEAQGLVIIKQGTIPMIGVAARHAQQNQDYTSQYGKRLAGAPAVVQPTLLQGGSVSVTPEPAPVVEPAPVEAPPVPAPVRLPRVVPRPARLPRRRPTPAQVPARPAVQVRRPVRAPLARLVSPRQWPPPERPCLEVTSYERTEHRSDPFTFTQSRAGRRAHARAARRPSSPPRASAIARAAPHRESARGAPRRDADRGPQWSVDTGRPQPESGPRITATGQRDCTQAGPQPVPRDRGHLHRPLRGRGHTPAYPGVRQRSDVGRALPHHPGG